MNLRDLLRSRQLTQEEALIIVPPICEALEFAHSRGIVHRDIKPENLLLDKVGRIKIADFGINRMLSPECESLPEDRLAGTPRYMAPEQWASPGDADHRVDIYALGVVIYEMLTGEAPTASLKRPSEQVSVDVRIDEIVLRALEKNPELRFQTVRDLKTQLQTVQSTTAAKVPEPTAPAETRSLVGPMLCLVLLGLVLLLTILLSHEASWDSKAGGDVGKKLWWMMWAWCFIVLQILGLLMLLIGAALSWQHLDWLRRQPRERQRQRHVGTAMIAAIIVPLVIVGGFVGSLILGMSLPEGMGRFLAMVVLMSCSAWMIRGLHCWFDQSPLSQESQGLRKALARYRGNAWLIAATGGALITPTPDAMTLTLLVVPIIVFYELIILMSPKRNGAVELLTESQAKGSLGTCVMLHSIAIVVALLATVLFALMSLDEDESYLLYNIRDKPHSEEELVSLRAELAAVLHRKDNELIGYAVFIGMSGFLFLIAPLPAWKRLFWLRERVDRQAIGRTMVLALTVPLIAICGAVSSLFRSPHKYGLWHSLEYPLVIISTLVICAWVIHRTRRWFDRPGSLYGARMWLQRLGGMTLLLLAVTMPTAMFLELEAISRHHGRKDWTEFVIGVPVQKTVKEQLAHATIELRRLRVEFEAETDPELRKRIHDKRIALDHERIEAAEKMALIGAVHEKAVKRFQPPDEDWRRRVAIYALGALLALCGWLMYLWRPRVVTDV